MLGQRSYGIERFIVVGPGGFSHVIVTPWWYSQRRCYIAVLFIRRCDIAVEFPKSLLDRVGILHVSVRSRREIHAWAVVRTSGEDRSETK